MLVRVLLRPFIKKIKIINKNAVSVYKSQHVQSANPGVGYVSPPFVEVTDNFGDFQQVINCTITTTTTSTTTTTTLPQTPSYQEYSFCMNVNIKGGGGRTGPVSYIFELS